VSAAAAIRPDLVLCAPVGEGVRAGDPGPLAEAWRRRGVAVDQVPTASAAVERALSAALPEDLVVVAGSFRLADEVSAALRRLS
jgi:folylpolyglutamate synthase/dihydropteroate synthase